MNRLKVILSFLFTVLLLVSTAQNKDNVYPFEYDGKNYEVVMEMRTFPQAVADAVQKGGHLVHINDAAENAAMWVGIVSGAVVPTDYTTVNDGGGIAYVWIGGTDQNEEGKWLWDGDSDNEGENFWNGEGNNGAGGGTAVEDAYHNWGGAPNPNEPDNYTNQDAAAIGLAGWPAGSGSLGNPSQWNDIKKANSLYYVIEYESSSIHNNKTLNGLEIYPNPFDQIIHIENLNAGSDELSVRIFDISGKMVMEQQCHIQQNYQMDLSGLHSGTYLMQITNSKQEVWIQKIQKR